MRSMAASVAAESNRERSEVVGTCANAWYSSADGTVQVVAIELAKRYRHNRKSTLTAAM